MFLWLCWYVNDEWGCYIIAPTRGRAKSMFNSYWGNICFGEYTDVRATKIKAADGYEEAVLDMDCETLAALDVHYRMEGGWEAADLGRRLSMDYKKLIDDLNQIAEMDFISCPDNAEAAIKAATAITDLLSRAEAAEAAQETLQRTVAEYKARAEKAERERDVAEENILDIFARIDDVRERVGIDNADSDGELAELCTGYCLHAGPMCYKRGESCKCENFKWRGQKEE